MLRGSKLLRWISVGASMTILLAGTVWLLRGCSGAHGGRGAPPAAATQRAVTPFEAAEVIYDAGLKPGWSDRSWTKRELAEGLPARVGFGTFGVLSLHHAQLSPNFGALVFRFKAPKSFQDFLTVSLSLTRQDERTFPHVPVTKQDIATLSDGWSEVLIPFRRLNPSGLPFDSVLLRARRLVPDDLVLVDKLVLTKPGVGAQQKSNAPTKRGAIVLECGGEARRISPLIYGIAQGNVASGETAHRIGGNAMTRLNWDLGNVWNTGNDWFFENVKSDDAGLPFWLSQAQSRGLQMALTVPTIGWVAKDSVSSGFPRAKFPSQRKFDEHRREAGDGFSPDGTPLTPGPPTETSEPAPPERIQRWVETIRERDRQSGKRSVQLYMLDNEPDLWHKTHRDVHPEPLTYDELLDRTIRFGTAVRKADPEAVIAGPASWGWTGYFFSAKDMEAGAMLQPDRRAHDGEPLLPWYLRKLAAHEKASGVRVLDVLDVHYYPQAEGVYSAASDSKTAELRLRSTRSLWDATYKDESWINDTVRLLPRLSEWIARGYPGRGISLGEWSFGGEAHISGGLATAEALGRFGQHGLHAAFYWNRPEAGSATFWAFRAFRNYDGKGAHFEDFSIKTRSPDNVSAFASRDERSSRFVVVILNLDPTYAAEVDLETSSCGALSRGRSFKYGAGSEGIILDTEQPPGLRALKIAPYSLQILELSAPPR
jgi:hypothetical protein